MAESLTLMQARPLTFSERMRLTYVLFWIRLPLPVDWLRALWSIGATASMSLTPQHSVRLHIESGNGQREVTVTLKKLTVT